MKTRVPTLAVTSEHGPNTDVRKLVMKAHVSTLAITLKRGQILMCAGW